MESQTGFTVWFTGLPCAGKRTLANLLARKLRDQGVSRVEVLDSSEVCRRLGGKPGSTREDQDTDARRIAFVCSLLSRNGVVAVAAAVSPRREIREGVRKMMPRFVEVFVDCPLNVCIERDVEGLYQRALAGEVHGFTGVSDTYEPPDNPEVICKTSEELPEVSVSRIVAALERLQYVAPSVAAYSAEEEELIRKRLEGLGYL